MVYVGIMCWKYNSSLYHAYIAGYGDVKHGKNWLIYYNLITRHAEWPPAESLDESIISMQGNNNVNDVQFVFVVSP